MPSALIVVVTSSRDGRGPAVRLLSPGHSGRAGIAAYLRAKDHALPDMGRRVLAVATMFAGAACGALLVLHASATAALSLAVGLLAVVTAGATLAARRPGSWRAG